MRWTPVVAAALLNVATGLAETDSYREVEVHNGGSVVGQVKFVGTPAAPEKLAVTADVAACGEEKLSEALVVGADGGVRNAVVYLREVPQGKAWEAREHVLGQTKCVFEPHVLLIPEGADLRILNHDRILHSVRSYGRDSVFNVGQPKFVEKLLVEDFTRQVSERDAIRVGCDLHPWMHAYVFVQKHPYYAVTDENGRFRLTGVPPGQYELRLWHESLGETARRVAVEPNGEASVTYELGRPRPQP